MATTAKRAARRADMLSKERIVQAAIAILDEGGENALTFRTLAARLATGSGAIYHHVAGKNELLTTAANDVITQALAETGGAEPRAAIRAIAAEVFDAIDNHPWVGTQLAREPWQTSMLQILEGIGGQLQALGVPEPAQFDSAMVLVNYVLGVAGQNAANAREHASGTDRTAFLGAVAALWSQLDAERYPFVRQIAAQLPVHDDREQFLDGIDLILAGITAA